MLIKIYESLALLYTCHLLCIQVCGGWGHEETYTPELFHQILQTVSPWKEAIQTQENKPWSPNHMPHFQEQHAPHQTVTGSWNSPV